MSERRRLPDADEIGAREPQIFESYGRDPILEAELEAVRAEVVRRGGQRGIVDGNRFPDLFERYEAAWDAARERAGVTFPKLKVKAGDFVRLNGFRWLVTSVARRGTTINIKRQNTHGYSLVDMPIDGTDLEPDPGPLTDEDRELLKHEEKQAAFSREVDEVKKLHPELNLAECIQLARKAKREREEASAGCVRYGKPEGW